MFMKLAYYCLHYFIFRIFLGKQLHDIVFTFINTAPTAAEIFINDNKYITVPSKSAKTIKLGSVTGRMIRVNAVEKKEDGSSNVAKPVVNLLVNGSSFGPRMLTKTLKSSSFIIHNKGIP